MKKNRMKSLQDKIASCLKEEIWLEEYSFEGLKNSDFILVDFYIKDLKYDFKYGESVRDKISYFLLSSISNLFFDKYQDIERVMMILVERKFRVLQVF